MFSFSSSTILWLGWALFLFCDCGAGTTGVLDVLLTLLVFWGLSPRVGLGDRIVDVDSFNDVDVPNGLIAAGPYLVVELNSGAEIFDRLFQVLFHVVFGRLRLVSFLQLLACAL